MSVELGKKKRVPKVRSVRILYYYGQSLAIQLIVVLGYKLTQYLFIRNEF